MIKGRNLDKELLVAGNRTVFDLSGAAASEMVLYNQKHDIIINKVWVHYEEATSADAGVALTLGSSADNNAYWEITSVISQDALTNTEYDTGSLTLATIPAGTPIYIAHAGSKIGTGTAFVWFSYTVV